MYLKNSKIIVVKIGSSLLINEDKKIREKWPHFLIGGASLTHEEAIKEVSEKRLDMVTWARYILANPDFVSKLEKNEQILDMTDDMRANLY